MAKSLRCLLCLGFLCAAISSTASGGLSVLSYTSTAGANAYAPLSADQYFTQNVVTGVSPGVADATGDWLGMNVGGSAITWHFVGGAHLIATTTFDTRQLAVSGAGSFGYELTTTSEFIDPSRSTVLYAPAAGVDYTCQFTLDAPASYSISATLGQHSKLELSSATISLVDVLNINAVPNVVSLQGTLAPGSYRVEAIAGNSARNLGIDEDYLKKGSFENFSFTVHVPEPELLPAFAAAALAATLVRRRPGA